MNYVILTEMSLIQLVKMRKIKKSLCKILHFENSHIEITCMSSIDYFVVIGYFCVRHVFCIQSFAAFGHGKEKKFELIFIDFPMHFLS